MSYPTKKVLWRTTLQAFSCQLIFVIPVFLVFNRRVDGLAAVGLLLLLLMILLFLQKVVVSVSRKGGDIEIEYWGVFNGFKSRREPVSDYKKIRARKRWLYPSTLQVNTKKHAWQNYYIPAGDVHEIQAIIDGLTD